jgi:hypothetical protein
MNPKSSLGILKIVMTLVSSVEPKRTIQQHLADIIQIEITHGTDTTIKVDPEENEQNRTINLLMHWSTILYTICPFFSFLRLIPIGLN